MTPYELIQAAKDEIGTHELPKGSNNIKYNTAYYGAVVNNKDFHWCVVFIWWLFNIRYPDSKELFCGGNKTASCSYVMDWAKQHKQWVTKDYKSGDLFLFDWNGNGKPQHIGIYTGEFDGNNYVTVEGNTGDSVAIKKRNIDVILGAYRPNYTNTVKNSDKLPPKYATEACEWAIKNGIIRGYKNKNSGEIEYRWLENLSRVDFITMLYRYNKYITK